MGNISDFLPMFPWEGPPLPRFLGVFWSSLLQGSALQLPQPTPPAIFQGPPVTETALVTQPQPAMGTYQNIERIELQDIDPDLLMPKTIIVHRNYSVIKGS